MGKCSSRAIVSLWAAKGYFKEFATKKLKAVYRDTNNAIGHIPKLLRNSRNQSRRHNVLLQLRSHVFC